MISEIFKIFDSGIDFQNFANFFFAKKKKFENFQKISNFCRFFFSISGFHAKDPKMALNDSKSSCDDFFFLLHVAKRSGKKLETLTFLRGNDGF